MVVRGWLGALGLLLLGTAIVRADDHPLVLGAAELDGIVAGTATSWAAGEAFAEGSDLAIAVVRGTTFSSTTAYGTSSTSTVVAEATGFGTGAKATTNAASDGFGNAGKFRSQVKVNVVAPNAASSVSVATTTTIGF